MKNHWDTIEARQVRDGRRALRHETGPADPLAERERKVRLWKTWAAQNPDKPQLGPFRGCWWYPFKMQPHFWHLLMPGVRAMLQARQRAWDEKWRADMKATADKWRQEKAERDAAKRRAKDPQAGLF